MEITDKQKYDIICSYFIRKGGNDLPLSDVPIPKYGDTELTGDVPLRILFY